MKSNQQQGSVLVTVLIFCILASCIVLLLLEKATLLQVMHQNVLADINYRISLEDSILNKEQSLYQNFNALEFSNMTFQQFVPDTLAFGENQGVDYFRIQEGGISESHLTISSTVAVRHG